MVQKVSGYFKHTLQGTPTYSIRLTKDISSVLRIPFRTSSKRGTESLDRPGLGA